jgi:hypothetical protein
MAFQLKARPVTSALVLYNFLESIDGEEHVWRVAASPVLPILSICLVGSRIHESV